MSNNFKCLRPKIIVNKVGDRVTVPCGHCKACETKRASKYTNLCVLEAQSHKYSFFVTLTYNQESLPVCHVENIEGHSLLVHDMDRFNYSVDEFIPNVIGELHPSVTQSSVASVFDKVYDPNAKTPYNFGEGYIPFVSVYDAQCFLKRLRYYINVYSLTNNLQNEKIRYYLASEYGPQHLRPHYHVLLFFNSSWLREALPRFLSQAWKLGNIDWSESSSNYGTAHYVASYCNSSATLPALYKSKGLCPFCLHSRYFGHSAFESGFQKIIKGESTEPVEQIVNFGERNSVLRAPLSLQMCFLPRCYHYSKTTPYLRHFLYGLFDYCVKRFDIREPSVAKIVDYVQSSEPTFFDFLTQMLEEPVDEKTFASILTSSRSYSKLREMFPCVDLQKRIENYYSDNDLRRLNEWYCSQQDFMIRFGYKNRRFLVHYYDNVILPHHDDKDVSGFDPSDLERSRRFFDSIQCLWYFEHIDDFQYHDNPEYKEMQALCQLIYDSRVKHKKYNDQFRSITQY